MKISIPSHKVQHYSEEVNYKLLKENLNLMDERREEIEIKAVTYKRRTKHYFNKKVKPMSFLIGNLVLRKIKKTNVRRWETWPTMGRTISCHS